MIKPQRPKAGLGYGSAITADQMKTRTPRTTAPKSRKPARVSSRKPERTKPDKP